MIAPDCRYTREHEWVRLDGEEVVFGITDYAQSALGEIVYVELPEVGRPLSQGEIFGTVEATKAASDLFTPIACEVTAVNQNLRGNEGLVNQDAFGTGWMVRGRASSPSDYSSLLSPEEYEVLVRELEAGH